jgi:hypothetical protein
VDQDMQLVLVLHRKNSLLRHNKSTITQFPVSSSNGQLMTTISDLTIILFRLQKNDGNCICGYNFHRSVIAIFPP